MASPKIKFKINGVIKDKDYNNLSFGRQLEYRRKIDEFKATAKRTHISQKRISHAKAWKEFIEQYQPTEYYTSYYDEQFCRDDSFEVFYKDKSCDTSSELLAS